MSHPHEPGRKNGSPSGHRYQGVYIGGTAKAHLGDTINYELESPLNRLPYATEAPFNSYQRQHEPTCLDNTRVDVLREIYKWAEEDERCIFWLSGLAGTGKSTIARTVARAWFERKALGASFFFSRGGGDVCHAGMFVTSIALQLASSIPTLHQYICDAITERGDISSLSLRDQWHRLVLSPLSKLDGDCCKSLYVLIVDALDECEDDNMRIVLHLLAEARSLEKVRLRVFLTSRPEIPIRYGFCQIPDGEHQDFVLHNISPSIVDHDIFIFLEYSLRLIGQERSLGAGWPREEIIKHLVQIASGLFIWAATACRFIREGKRFEAKRLDTIVRGSGSSVTAPEKHLNEIYTTVLKHYVSPKHTDEEKKESYYLLRKILGSIAILFSPLSAYSFGRLLRVTKEDIDKTLEDLHSVLDVPKDQTQPLRLHHPSFRDFLLNSDRCKDRNFWVDGKQAHHRLADSCIQHMSASLKQDICCLNTPGVLVTDVESSRVERSLPPELQYACLYWIQHLHKSGAQLRDNDQVHQFLQEHLLHWLETLGWMQKVSEGIYAIASLQSIAAVCECPRLSEFVHDTKRFVLYNRLAIEQAPLQTYYSALVFSPMNSIIRQYFAGEIPYWIKRLPHMQNNWSAALQTLEGHSRGVEAVAFSPDGQQVASASDDRTVRLWDAVTGAVLQTLEGHTSFVFAVVFSRDGQHVASASDDQTVRLWDTVTGVLIQTLEGHTSAVVAVTFSPDGKLIASASYDWTVWLWDATTGAVVQTLEGPTGAVVAVTFSPDGKLVASASYDQTVWLWDASTGAAVQTLEGHISAVVAVTFSPDGKLVASASDDQMVRLWDTVTGTLIQTLEGHTSAVVAVTFSPDGQQVASASDDQTVWLWDAATGAALQTLEGHTDKVRAVAFSPDSKRVASASDDQTVRLWDAATGAALQTLKGHTHRVTAVAFSPDGKQVASASNDMSVRLWDTTMGAAVQTLEGHTRKVTAVAFSPEGKQVASASDDQTVRLWGTATGAALQILEGHIYGVRAVAFSPDGQCVASASYDQTVRLWDAATGAALQTLEGHIRGVTAVAFSPDGQCVASASYDRTVRLWDTATGTPLQTLEGHTDKVRAVAFSPDSKRVASASDDRTVRFWETATGTPLQTLKANIYGVRVIAFSPDGSCLPDK